MNKFENLEESPIVISNINDKEAYSNIYEKIVLDKINKQFNILTPPFPCEICVVEDDLSEGANLIEVDCPGLYGRHFSLLPEDNCDLIEVGDKVIISYEDCYDVATVLENGSLARLKRKCQQIPAEEFTKYIRKFTEEDIHQLETNQADENKARPIFLELSKKYELDMKLVNIHYQFDRKKLFFFYTADGRVDFRELAKGLASKFKTRIELRQIGVRDEAKKTGGIGTCGREFCCSSFLTNFKRITTQLASEQNLSTNLSKLSGPCGKLKCCLSYEVDNVDLEKLAEVRLDAIADTEV